MRPSDVSWAEETARVALAREARMQALVRSQTSLREFHAERAGAARGLAFRLLEQVYDWRLAGGGK